MATPDEVRREVEGMARRAKDLTSVLEPLATTLAALIDKSFEESQAPDGSAWKPLSPKTIAGRGGKRGKARRRRVQRTLLSRERGRARRGASLIVGAGGETLRDIGLAAAIANNPPLVDTGRLRRSIRVTAERYGIRIRTGVQYAAAQQFGTPRIPARPFLPVTPSEDFMEGGEAGAWMDKAEQAVADWIESGRLP